VTQRDYEKSGRDGLGDEPEARLARARTAFDQGLREASETGTRAARRLLVPALWGAALVGGTLLAIAFLRMTRRPSYSPALLRVSIEPRLQSRALLPALGGVVARFAVKRLLEAPAIFAGPQASTLPEARRTGSHRTGPTDSRSPDSRSRDHGSRPAASNGRASA